MDAILDSIRIAFGDGASDHERARGAAACRALADAIDARPVVIDIDPDAPASSPEPPAPSAPASSPEPPVAPPVIDPAPSAATALDLPDASGANPFAGMSIDQILDVTIAHLRGKVGDVQPPPPPAGTPIRIQLVRIPEALVSPRRYEGQGVGEMKTARTRAVVQLAGPDAATFLPDPGAAYKNLKRQFIDANGSVPSSSKDDPELRLTVRDVKLIANYTTYALRNDLPSIDRHDAMVIWDTWRNAVENLRKLMRSVTDDEQALVIGTVLDMWLSKVESSLATALTAPGQVYEHYCPWKADWATWDRLYPESV